MLIKGPADIKSSEITSRVDYLSRRTFIRHTVGAGLAGVAAGNSVLNEAAAQTGVKLPNVTKSPLSTSGEMLTPYTDVTTYNNFYEFGTAKEDPAANSGRFKPKPWSVAIEGECSRPGTYNLEDLLKPYQLEERIYRMRCVEAWSMVIPWVGIPLAGLLKQFEPNANAKFVAFKTITRPAEMPGLRYDVLDWPYIEGLRIDEAMHPLSILAVGLYGEELPNQNGAPLRLVVPWKYGFKGIKSIVSIRFTDKQPRTSWNLSAPREYGFYSNVNPLVDHPRWSQAKERRIGKFLKQDTLMFNGYADQVASLYTGMDLKRNF